MPTPYEPFDTAGRECSSTYEGRHVTLRADMFESPTGTVTYGDPVVFGAIPNGYGVGVAFDTEVNASDWIAVDTEGIWALTVLGTDDEGGSRVEIGDIIYINRTTCVLSKISSDTTNIVFGYALDTVAESGSAVICVKVHWDPHRTDEYRDFTGTGNENGMLIDIDDDSETIGGTNNGLRIQYQNTGEKTDGAYISGLTVSMNHTNDVGYDYGVAIYNAASDNPTIAFRAALSIFSQDAGTNVGNWVGIDVGMIGANPPSTRHTFMRFRAHTGANIPESIFLLEGSTGVADFLFDLTILQTPWEGIDCTVAAEERIKVRIQGATKYIRLYDS